MSGVPELLARVRSVLASAPAGQGFLTLATDHGERGLLLGPSTDLATPIPTLDWRTAPLAEVFFRHAPGEPYELEVNDRTQSGTVRSRYLILDHGASLLSDDHLITNTGQRLVPRPQPAPTPPPDREALIVLDPEQRAVDLTADTSLVLDGEAGVGKTLVALYRVAALERRARAKSRRFRALVLVPTEGLRRLVRLLAERLDIPQLEIAVFDEWLLARGRTAFTGLPKRTSEHAIAQVIALKRHPAVRAVLDDFIGWRPPKGVENDDKVARSRMRLLHLFGDRDRLQRVVDLSHGDLPPRAIAQVMQHTRIQFETTTEKQFRHVDADRLVALDGRSLDSGTPTEDANTFDLEDIPILFELVRRGALPDTAAPPPKPYDHIVVDEAQLRAPLELAVVGDALAPHGTVTLAGDHRQATDETAWFTGWAAARAELRRPRWAESTLAITYRSVPAISTFARALSGRTTPPPPAGQPIPSAAASVRTAQLPDEPPADPAVWATRCPHALAQAAQICWHLDALLRRDPWRQVCVIAPTPEHATRLHGELRGLDATLVLDGDFRFEPGVIVTTAAAVSGLEFDAVVIPDLTPAFYPASPELARSLYVAATRARDWLWLLAPEAWSPLVVA